MPVTVKMYSFSGLRRKCILDWPCGTCSLLLFVLFSMKKLPGCPFCLLLLPAAWWSVTIPSDSPKLPSTQCQGSCGHWFGWLDLGVGKVTPTSRVFFLVPLFTISKSPVVENEAVTSYSRAAGSTSTSAWVTCIVRGMTLIFYFEAEEALSLPHLQVQNFLYSYFQFKESLQDCYYMIIWVKLKRCKPSTPSKTSVCVYIYAHFGEVGEVELNLNQLCPWLGLELTFGRVNFKSAAERHNGRSTHSFIFWTRELQVFLDLLVYPVCPIQNCVLGVKDGFAHSTTNI